MSSVGTHAGIPGITSDEPVLYLLRPYHSCLPLARLICIDGAPAGSTPITRAFEPDSLIAEAMPAMRPPPVTR